MTGEARAAARERLLLAAVAHVAFDGWGREALEAGASDAGMTPADIGRYFPGGARDAIADFSDWADARMAVAMASRDLAALRVRERIALAVRLRLEALGPHREAVRRGLPYLALPTNAALGARLLYRTVDAMWRAIGDRPADFSFYTKRALLAGVVSSTTLCWLGDDSEGFAETDAFLDRRIADVLRIPALKARGERLFRRLPDPFRILRAVRGG